jgi:hypothetical protein
MQDTVDERVWSIQSVPESLPDHLAGVNLGLTNVGGLKIGIGQRAIFLQTEHGNVLWDLVPFIDDHFINEVNEKGGLKAIVVSSCLCHHTHPGVEKTDITPTLLQHAFRLGCRIRLPRLSRLQR